VSLARAEIVAAIAVAAAVLAGCGETKQAMTGAGKKSDPAPWAVSSSANPAYVAPGWKAGDKAAWEAQMTQRNQAQNDYVR
jgi:predicted small secreted protein